jgi:hypothetical protein
MKNHLLNDDIKAAEAVLFAARKLPPGAQRYAALVVAGKQRYDAHRNLLQKSGADFFIDRQPTNDAKTPPE